MFHITVPCSVNDKPDLESNEAQWTNNSFLRNRYCFLWLRLSFRIFNEISPKILTIFCSPVAYTR